MKASVSDGEAAAAELDPVRVCVLPQCPVCRGATWTDRIWATRLRRCRSCGTFFNDRSLSRLDEEKQYQDGSAAASREGSEVARSQWQTLAAVIAGVALPDRSVLDIGCGRGDFLMVAQEHGWKVGGLEIDPVSAAACRERGLVIEVGSLFDHALPSGPWSVITLWDVLDHLEDPNVALERAMAELAPGGVLLVRGRNAAVHARLKLFHCMIAPAASAVGLPDLAVVHRWGFSTGGWRRMMTTAGCKLVRMHPAAPTPGDRYGMLGPKALGRMVKGLVAWCFRALYCLSGGRVYPYASAVVSGRK